MVILTSEVLFVDPAVSDLETILAELRPGVEAVLLDGARPAAEQMAAALCGRQGLAAVHVMAHGAPGRVVFSSGDWSISALERDARHLTAIGQSLAEDGELRLWSCETGRGEGGDASLDVLSGAPESDVAAATARMGVSVLGGAWELGARTTANPPNPPLSVAG